MNIAVHLDRTGWFEKEHGPLVQKRWESITTDELTLRSGKISNGFPKLSDIAEVRWHFSQRAKSLNGGVISCDGILLNGQEVFKVIYKYATAKPTTGIGAGAVLRGSFGNLRRILPKCGVYRQPMATLLSPN